MRSSPAFCAGSERYSGAPRPSHDSSLSSSFAETDRGRFSRAGAKEEPEQPIEARRPDLFWAAGVIARCAANTGSNAPASPDSARAGVRSAACVNGQPAEHGYQRQWRRLRPGSLFPARPACTFASIAARNRGIETSPVK